MNWQHYPLIRLVIPFTLGMVGANLFICHMDQMVLFLLCCAVLAFLLFLLPQQKDSHRDGKFGVVAMALAFLIGMTLYTEKHHCIQQGVPQDTTFSQGILTFSQHQQERLHTIYRDHGIDEEAGSIVEAMTIGRKTDLSRQTRTAYAHAGVSHLLALSGFHISIIVLMIQVFFLKSVLPLRWQWVNNLFIITTLWGYALLTGLSPSLVRATTMFTILLLCQSFTRDLLSINSCALAFFVMLCIDPRYLLNIGFQLSFASVVGISLFCRRFINLSPTRNSVLFFLWGTILITLICTVFTAPLVAYHFGNIPLLSVFSNLLLTLFVYLIMCGSILWWLFLWCNPVNALLTEVLNWTADTMNHITHTMASLPFASIEWHPHALTVLLCYLLLLLFSYFITHPTPTTP